MIREFEKRGPTNLLTVPEQTQVVNCGRLLNFMEDSVVHKGGGTSVQICNEAVYRLQITKKQNGVGVPVHQRSVFTSGILPHNFSTIYRAAKGKFSIVDFSPRGFPPWQRILYRAARCTVVFRNSKKVFLGVGKARSHAS